MNSPNNPGEGAEEPVTGQPNSGTGDAEVIELGLIKGIRIIAHAQAAEGKPGYDANYDKTMSDIYSALQRHPSVFRGLSLVQNDPEIITTDEGDDEKK